MVPMLDLSTIGEGQNLVSIDDILNRNPMDTLKEAFAIKHKKPMSEQQEVMLQDLLNGIKNETTD
jgi:exonuclease SbcD